MQPPSSFFQHRDSFTSISIQCISRTNTSKWAFLSPPLPALSIGHVQLGEVEEDGEKYIKLQLFADYIKDYLADYISNSANCLFF